MPWSIVSAARVSLGLAHGHAHPPGKFLSVACSFGPNGSEAPEQLQTRGFVFVVREALAPL